MVLSKFATIIAGGNRNNVRARGSVNATGHRGRDAFKIVAIDDDFVNAICFGVQL